MKMASQVLFKVNTKKSKKEPCRICNTKSRPCIDLIKNVELLETVNAALGLLVSSDSRLSKSVCVVCMSLVRLFEEFKKVCYDNQNDLWMMEQHLVKDRGSEVIKLLLRAKNTSIPGQKEAVVVEPDLNYLPEPKKPRFEIIEDVQSEISFGEEMIEEHLEEPEIKPAVRYMCQHLNCDRLFPSKKEMEEHLSTHQVVRNRTKPYITLQRRNESLKLDSYTCQVCKKVFKDIAGLVQHRKIHHLSKKCEICGMAVPGETFVAHQAQCKREKAKKTEARGGIKIEITSLVPPDTALYKCGRCEAKFKTADSYRLHSKICAKTF